MDIQGTGACSDSPLKEGEKLLHFELCTMLCGPLLILEAASITFARHALTHMLGQVFFVCLFLIFIYLAAPGLSCGM